MLAHGHYTIERHGQIVVIRCIGLWTHYTAKQMSQEVLHIVKQFQQQPWSALFNTTDWELGTPNIWLPIGKLIQWSALNNQKKTAVVYKKKLPLLMLSRVMEPYQNIEYQAFSGEESAKKWLSEFEKDDSDVERSTQ